MPNTEKIKELNDQFRTSLRGGKVLVTRGLADRPDLPRIMEKVRTFDQFDQHNDPWQEHDFGAFQINGDHFYFKIDVYNSNMTCGSPDPSDPAVTYRVMTIMLAHEY